MSEVVDRCVHPTRRGCLVPDAAPPVVEVDVCAEPVRADKRARLGTCRPCRTRGHSGHHHQRSQPRRIGTKWPRSRTRRIEAGRRRRTRRRCVACPRSAVVSAAARSRARSPERACGDVDDLADDGAAVADDGAGYVRAPRVPAEPVQVAGRITLQPLSGCYPAHGCGQRRLVVRIVRDLEDAPVTRRRLRRARRAAEVGAPRCASRSLSTRRQANLITGRWAVA